MNHESQLGPKISADDRLSALLDQTRQRIKIEERQALRSARWNRLGDRIENLALLTGAVALFAGHNDIVSDIQQKIHRASPNPIEQFTPRTSPLLIPEDNQGTVYLPSPAIEQK